MELMFIALGGAILGLAARYALPRRHLHGSVLVPAIGTAAAAVTWVVLTWFGMPWDGGWIWLVSLVCSGLAAAGADVLIGRRREASDAALAERLQRPGAQLA